MNLIKTPIQLFNINSFNFFMKRKTVILLSQFTIKHKIYIVKFTIILLGKKVKIEWYLII